VSAGADMNDLLWEIVDSIPHPEVATTSDETWHSFNDAQLEQLIWRVVDACADRMEFRDDARVMPRPTWQLYELFGRDWRPHWEPNEYLQWHKKTHDTQR